MHTATQAPSTITVERFGRATAAAVVWSCVLFSVHSPFTSCHFSLSDSISAPEYRCRLEPRALVLPDARGHQWNKRSRQSITGRKGGNNNKKSHTRQYDSQRDRMLVLFAASWHYSFSACFTSCHSAFSFSSTSLSYFLSATTFPPFFVCISSLLQATVCCVIPSGRSWCYGVAYLDQELLFFPLLVWTTETKLPRKTRFCSETWKLTLCTRKC